MRPVDLSDASARRDWLEALRTKILDLVGIADDAARPKAKRFFSRAEQRRRIAELERALLGLLDEAGGSLRPMALAPPAQRPHPWPDRAQVPRKSRIRPLRCARPSPSAAPRSGRSREGSDLERGVRLILHDRTLPPQRAVSRKHTFIGFHFAMHRSRKKSLHVS